MYKSIVFSLLFIPYIGLSQVFELIKPSSIDTLEVRIDSYRNNDVIYNYLIKNYYNSSEKINVKTFDYEKSTICSFTQYFKYNIKYFADECPEEGGMKSAVTFPKMNDKSVVEWIESIHNNEMGDIENSWNPDKTIFSPTDGAGCSYTIIETDSNTIINIWCGC